MPVKNVTLVGSSGSLGAVLLDALVSAGTFRVTVLKRANSSAASSAGSGTGSDPAEDPAITTTADRTVTVPAIWTEDDLIPVLKGEDAVIACFRPRDPPTPHLTLASAAAAAGVTRFIPADFGSVDALSARARELAPIFERKLVIQQRLEELAVSTPGFSWTSIVSGHFFDWGLKEGFLHIDLARKKAQILGDGEQRSSLSTLAQVSRGLVAVLRKEEDTRNRRLFVQSFCVSQNRVVEAVERAAGGEKWERKFVGFEDFVAEGVVRRDAGDPDAIEDLVFALGVMEGNWEKKEDFAMELLGLEEEDLDEVVRGVVGR